MQSDPWDTSEWPIQGKTGAKCHLSNTSRHDQSLSEKNGVATYKTHGLQS
jgi:hypothetical protein